MLRRTPFSIAWESYFRDKDQARKQSIPRLFPQLYDDERCNQRMSKLQLVICEHLPGDVGEEIELSINEIDYQDSVGNTALHWAIQCRNPDVVKTLLSHGADPALPDFSSMTPLHLAANFDHKSIFLLLGAGVRYDVRDKRGETPLHTAARFGHRDLGLYISPLLDAGADINARDNKGITPLDHACMEDNSDTTIGYLIQRGADTNLTDFGLYISPLLDAGADINARDNKGITPLDHACMEDNSDTTIGYLIQRGADTNLTDFDGLSPVFTAIQWEHASYVEILLEAGADCCVTTADGSNILHFVAHWGNIEIMQALLKWRRRLKDLDVNLKDKDGDTPLDRVDFRDEEVSGEWAETFDELLTAILQVQDGAMDESEESDGEEWITTDDDEESQDEYARSDLEDEDEHDGFGKEDSSEEGKSGERFEDALEAQDGFVTGDSY